MPFFFFFFFLQLRHSSFYYFPTFFNYCVKGPHLWMHLKKTGHKFWLEVQLVKYPLTFLQRSTVQLFIQIIFLLLHQKNKERSRRKKELVQNVFCQLRCNKPIWYFLHGGQLVLFLRNQQHSDLHHLWIHPKVILCEACGIHLCGYGYFVWLGNFLLKMDALDYFQGFPEVLKMDQGRRDVGVLYDLPLILGWSGHKDILVA